jgi:GT2 family glycosyltransferase
MINRSNLTPVRALDNVPTETVAAIVVTFNRKELLLECLNALLNQTTSSALDILIIDNASTDGTREVLRDQIANQRIHYVNTGKNLGGAGGFEFGFREAVRRGYDYIWAMDDDCIPQSTALQSLLSTADSLDGDFGFLVSKVLWKDGDICDMNIPRTTMFRKAKDFSAPLVSVSMASFVSLFVSSNTVREFGLPIGEFFIWTDDWEFTRRISRVLPCYLATQSVVIHKSSNNFGANIAAELPDRLERFWYLYRNDVYLYSREGLPGIMYETIRIVSHTVRIALHAKNNRARRLRLMLQGTFAGLAFHPTINYPNAE